MGILLTAPGRSNVIETIMGTGFMKFLFSFPSAEKKQKAAAASAASKVSI